MKYFQLQMYCFSFVVIFFFLCGLESLTKVLEGEREDRGTFQAVPFHYIEISRLLFDQ